MKITPQSTVKVIHDTYKKYTDTNILMNQAIPNATPAVELSISETAKRLNKELQLSMKDSE